MLGEEEEKSPPPPPAKKEEIKKTVKEPTSNMFYGKYSEMDDFESNPNAYTLDDEFDVHNQIQDSNSEVQLLPHQVNDSNLQQQLITNPLFYDRQFLS